MDISAYQHMNIRMSTRGKRPLRNLTPSDKVRAIQRIHNGETKASVSRDIGVPESTLRGWCKNEQKLRFMCRQLGSSADQMSLALGSENPPEKRSRYDSHLTPKFPQLSGFEDFPYGRLSLGGMDFAAALNGGTGRSMSGGAGTALGLGNNAILDKIAFNEFMKHNTLQAEQSNKTFGANLHLQGMMNSLPVASASPSSAAEYPHLSMIQNLNLLSLLNPGLAAMSGGFGAGVVGCDGAAAAGVKSKTPLRTSNSADASRDLPKSDSPVVSVKNWAKDPTEGVSPRRNNGTSGSAKAARNANDTNNNDVLSKNAFLLSDLSGGGGGANAQSLFAMNALPLPAGTTGGPATNGGTAEDGANSPLLDWCKVFNASLNFLALAAAAASLQSPQPGGGPGMPVPPESTSPMTALSSSNDEAPIMKLEQQDGSTVDSNKLLYKQLTKSAAMAAAAGERFSPTDTMHSDLSNDSYFDSEPEDLSVRSATSKMSSPQSSRSPSQSPTKSTISNGTSVHSDGERDTPSPPPPPPPPQSSPSVASAAASSTTSTATKTTATTTTTTATTETTIDKVTIEAASGSTN